MERVSVDGAELEMAVQGTGEPVVLIHGVLIADAFTPLLTEPVLSGRYRLIHYHRRGYAGSSRITGPVSLAQQAADCWGLLDHLGIARAHVVGHSYGGAIALQLALDAPDVVASLALLEPGVLVGVSAHAWQAAWVQQQAQVRAGDAAAAVDAFLLARFGAGYRPVLDRAAPGAFAQAVADAGTTFEVELPALADWRFSEAEARRITQPVLSVLGEASDALSPRFGETHERLLAWLPQAEGFILPGATHALQLQNPHAMAAALDAFFARHPLATTA
jgi:pimeloyl-ACP methyl ester carboxylesterase